MGKKLNESIFKWLLIAGIFVIPVAQAQEVFIDCSDPTTNADQCTALYTQQGNFLPYATDPQPAFLDAQPTPMYDPMTQMVQQEPIFATPGLVPNGMPSEQIIFRDTAAPISVSQPIDDFEEAGSEYAVYETPQGSLIVEKDVSHQQIDDGSMVQVTHTKETTVTPQYVEMPAISDVRRAKTVAKGEEVQDWDALEGDTLRNLLVEWGSRSGWTVVWKLDRDYILEAGVVFRGSFTEVASAIIRTFARANPAPIGTFYKGNRVLVINTQEDDNA